MMIDYEETMQYFSHMCDVCTKVDMCFCCMSPDPPFPRRFPPALRRRQPAGPPKIRLRDKDVDKIQPQPQIVDIFNILHTLRPHPLAYTRQLLLRPGRLAILGWDKDFFRLAWPPCPRGLAARKTSVSRQGAFKGVSVLHILLHVAPLERLVGCGTAVDEPYGVQEQAPY